MSKALASRACLDLKFQAFAVAQSAKAGVLPVHDVERLGELTDNMVEGPDHPLIRAVTRFVTEHKQHRRNRAMIYELGVELGNAIDRLNMPEPPDQGRADIYG